MSKDQQSRGNNYNIDPSLIDPSSTPFPEIFLKTIANDGLLPYQLKCLAIGVLLYLPGLIIAFLTSTTDVFLDAPSFLFSCILVGVLALLLIRYFKKIVNTILEINQIIGVDNTKFENFVKWTQQNDMIFFYYFDSFGMAIISALFSYFVILCGPYRPPWISNKIAEMYFVSWWTIVAFISGIFICRIFNSVFVIRKYSRDFITPEKVKPLDPDMRGGLKGLGNLILDLEVAVATPSLVFLMYGSIFAIEKNVMIWSDPFFLFFIVSYTLLLIVVFIVPLISVHNSMLDAKIQYLKKIRALFREHRQYTNIGESLNDAENLQNIHFLYTTVDNMFTWPVSFGTFLRFIVTFLIPLIIGLVIEIIF